MNIQELEKEYKNDWESKRFALKWTMPIAGIFSTVFLLKTFIEKKIDWEYLVIIMIIWMYLIISFHEANDKLKRLKNDR